MNQDLSESNQSKDAKPLTLDAIASLVKDLSNTMNDAGVGRLSIKYGDLRIKITAAERGHQHPDGMAPERQIESEQNTVENSSVVSDDCVVTAPMIGTFYIAAAPNEPPFVQVGDVIEEGQTIGIIEAMKIMNEIAADYSGRVTEVVAADGDTVEYGSPLVILAPIDS